MAKQPKQRKASVLAFLERQVWKNVPKQELGRTLSRAEEDALLGYGPDGYAASS